MKKRLLSYLIAPLTVWLLSAGCASGLPKFSGTVPDGPEGAKYSKKIPEDPKMCARHGDITVYSQEGHFRDPVFNMKYKGIHVFDLCGLPPLFFEDGKYIMTCAQLRDGKMKVDRVRISDGAFEKILNRKRIVIIEKSSGRVFCSQVFRSDFVFDPKADFVFEKGILRVFRRSRNAGWSFTMHELK